MTTSRRLFRACVATAALAALPIVSAGAQEIGAYVAAGVGGIRDVRRPFGGGFSAALMWHDRLGVRADAGQYWTLEHRTGLYCIKQTNEAGPRCVTARLSSHSQFPLVSGMAMLRAHIPNKGVRFEVGAGPSWVNVTSHISANSDSLPSTDVSSARRGATAMAGLLATPQWRIPVTLEGIYAYHMTGAFGACSPSRQNDPLCDQHLNFHEVRFAVLYRPRSRRR